MDDLDQYIREYGYNNICSGNYVHIKHPNEEYSFYAHFIPHSVTIRKGDKVKQGQVIGKVGNSGNSTSPHLHFQLADGQDHLIARGLPCSFTNLRNCEGKKISFVERSNSLVHAD